MILGQNYPEQRSDELQDAGLSHLDGVGPAFAVTPTLADSFLFLPHCSRAISPHMSFRLFRKRTVHAPTWQGWLLILLLLTSLGWATLTTLYPFLSPDGQPHQGLFVIEGWVSDVALEKAVEIYHDGKYEKIITTGTPIETGEFLVEWDSYAQMTTARLIKMGVAESDILTAIGHDVRRDRTYAAALAMREALKANDIAQTNIHLLTVGPHGRRSRLLYRKALGDSYTIGTTCLEPETYDAARWWTSSNGFREVVSEWIAYLYAKFLFHP